MRSNLLCQAHHTLPKLNYLTVNYLFAYFYFYLIFIIKRIKSITSSLSLTLNCHKFHHPVKSMGSEMETISSVKLNKSTLDYYFTFKSINHKFAIELSYTSKPIAFCKWPSGC